MNATLAGDCGLRSISRWWVACAMGMLAASAQAAGVAMVTDLQGKAVASIAGRSADLTILADIEPGTRVELAAGATLVTLYLESGDEYAFKGPAAIEFRLAQPQVLTGAAAERRSLELGTGAKPIRIKPVGMTQGAIVMRGIRPDPRIQLVNLNRTRTLETAPVFLWKELQPGQKYGFELRDKTGRVVYETEVSTTSLKLPATVPLAEGTPYTWEISARLPDGRKYSSTAEFALAAADVRAEAEALRPAASSPLSTRIAYAAWLDQMGLKDEARRYWKAAAAERPEDTRLKSLSAS